MVTMGWKWKGTGNADKVSFCVVENVLKLGF